eukprot:11183091-Lingulodinium_polyedra.AAC.1
MGRARKQRALARTSTSRGPLTAGAAGCRPGAGRPTNKSTRKPAAPLGRNPDCKHPWAPARAAKTRGALGP